MKRATKNNKLMKLLIGIAVVVLIIILFTIKSVFFGKEAEKGYSVYTVTEEIPLKLDGNVIASDSRDISFDATLGKITEINVENGQEVTKDTPLLTYTNSSVQATETEQENTLNRNNIQVEQAQENVDLAAQAYNEAASKVDEAKQKLNSAKDEAEKEALKAEVQQLNEAVTTASSTLAQAKQTLQLAYADVTSTSNLLDQTRGQLTTVVNAPIDGQVTVDESAISSAEKPVIKIVTPKKNIQGKVTEYDLDKIQQDEEVTVTTVGSDKSSPGKIVSISQSPTENKGDGSSSTPTYQFTVDGDFPWASGLSVSIAVPQKQMLIPSAAIQKDGDKEVVYVYKNNKVKKTPIETETELGRKVVKNGLNWKEKLILNPAKDLKDNQEVQVEEK